MHRGFLRWFYVSVQFVMLAVSIPKVANLFHAYDAQQLGPTIAGIDPRSWLVGIAIDLTATLTTWAAMAKFEETRSRLALIPPALIIFCCTALSVVANYEEAATLNPVQYQHISLFEESAALVNPLLISSPPMLVLLLVLLVPSVLAQPRIRTGEEIEAQTAEQEALINAKARLKAAQARANARVRGEQLKGLSDNFSTITKRVQERLQDQLADELPPDDPEPEPEPPAPAPIAPLPPADVAPIPPSPSQPIPPEERTLELPPPKRFRATAKQLREAQFT